MALTSTEGPTAYEPLSWTSLTKTIKWIHRPTTSAKDLESASE